MQRTRAMRVVILVGIGVMLGWFAGDRYRSPPPPVAQAAASVPGVRETPTLAAPGRVEGRSDAVNVSAGIDGVLSSVLVQEGHLVKAGAVVARVDRPDLVSELEHARAVAESVRQAKIRLVRGTRDEERQGAAAEVARATAVVEQAKTNFIRQEKLHRSEDIPRAVYDRARSELSIAEAGLRAALEHERLVNAEPLQEELARADSEITSAEERVRVIAARMEKCSVRTPVSGRVVRRFMQPGEVVSTVFPQPIVSIVDTSTMRVRAEVDERDLRHVRGAQKISISADALGSERVEGHVVSLGSSMGRKRVRTGDPAEKSDRDVLEVLIDLDSNDSRLVLGLRVTVHFLASEQVSMKRTVTNLHYVKDSSR